MLSIIGLAYPDARMDQEANEANLRFYLIVLACELPVLILALISWRYFKGAFWLGWAINVAFALFLTVLVVWLELFWHW